MPPRLLEAATGPSRRESCATDNDAQHYNMGPLPKPGQWTLLEMNAVDFEMDEFEIQGIDFTSFGGLTHFEHASASSIDKDMVLLADGLPKDVRIEGNPMTPVPAPHHTLPRSWTGNATGGLLNTSFNYPEAAPWFSFKTPVARRKDPKRPSRLLRPSTRRSRRWR